MSIRKGEEWGEPAGDATPDLTVAGDDAALAAALAGDGSDPLVRFSPSPDSDLARALGLTGGPAANRALPLDVLGVDALGLDPAVLAVNLVVFGTPPDRLRWWHRPVEVEVTVDGTVRGPARATTVVVANGQFLRGLDVSPRGHPGDGWCEFAVYRLAPGQRRPMRSRLDSGSHLPHPEIATGRGRSVQLRATRPLRLEIDGRPAGRVAGLDVHLVPAAYRLLV